MRLFADAPFFIANPLQANALARLRQALTYPGGVAVLSGGPGVGKSAFIRQSLASVDSDVQLLTVDLRSAEPADLHEAMLAGLGVMSADGAGQSTVNRLREVLLAQRASGRQLILSLDVPGLNVDLARRLLRLLHLTGELGTPMSFVLQGPHGLHQLLDVPGLIQLRQRLSFRLKVRPLNLLETAGYLRHCLAAGQANADDMLVVNAPACVHLYVAGVPRLINTVMDAALGERQARRLARIDAELIRQVAEQLGWKPIAARRGPAATGRVTPVAAVPEPKPDPTAGAAVAASITPDALPAGEVSRRLQVLALPESATAPTTVEPVQKAALPHASTVVERPPPLMPMDAHDTSATGMLRLEDLDERFAETLFSEDSGHFKALVDAGKPG